jgi:hypothetical protein
VLRVADGKRGLLRVPLAGEIANASCIRCGAKATQRRLLLVDGKYRYRPLLLVIGGASLLFGPALVAVVPLLTAMSRVSREHMRIHVGMCSLCDDWLKKRAVVSRVLEALASLFPLAGCVVAGVEFHSMAALYAGAILGTAATVAAVAAVNRRNPDDHARLLSADASGWLLDVPATWKNAIASDPNPEIASMAVDDARPAP